MKLWYYSLWLSIISCSILFIVFLLPDNYSVFVWSKTHVDAGILFPVLLISWTAALFGFALNNIYIDKSIHDKYSVKMNRLKTYFPSLLGLPAYISFMWFIFRWCRGKPGI